MHKLNSSGEVSRSPETKSPKLPPKYGQWLHSREKTNTSRKRENFFQSQNVLINHENSWRQYEILLDTQHENRCCTLTELEAFRQTQRITLSRVRKYPVTGKKKYKKWVITRKCDEIFSTEPSCSIFYYFHVQGETKPGQRHIPN
jgi:hypothetical protein